MANEVVLNEQTIARFRTGYMAAFAGSATDPLYEAVSAGRRYPGMEHWLPLFYPDLATLFDYLPDAAFSLDHLADEALDARRGQIEESYGARQDARGRDNFGAPPYNPLSPDRLYLSATEVSDHFSSHPLFQFTPFEVPETATVPVISVGGRQGRSFAAERAETGRNIYQAVKEHADVLRQAGKRVLVATWSEGSRDRLETILHDHDLRPLAVARDWNDVLSAPRELVSIVVLGLESGFETADLAIIAEQDILGDRLVRRTRRHRKATDFIAELQSLTPGDLVVHVEHGIGRFEGLKVIEVQGAPHDCVHLSYAGGDRLFLPVENLELISRFGSDEAGVQLDRLGTGAWQARKSRLKERVREIANELIRTAAARQLRPGEILAPPDGLYDEFCARFPYEETEDQLTAIQAVLEDLQAGRPMDRLICGDVGFGKTEVALRTAFCRGDGGQASGRHRADHPLGAPALCHFQRAVPGSADQHRPRLEIDAAQGPRRDQGWPRVRGCRHRGRHPCAAGQGCEVPFARRVDYR